ncbi:MAG: hypothetical protein ACFFDF_22740 [Candidatus Odinarchaeota archaeon]
MSYIKRNKLNDELVNQNVPIFHLNWDAGDMLILALESCLKYLGQEIESWWLAGISGDAFKLVYDKDDVRETMRDRVPTDIVSIACSICGWEGKWYFDEPLETTKSRIKDSLEKGYPIITSNLGSQWYHGANIIVGINENTNHFFLQIGREDLSKSYEYEKISIPKNWDGPVPGPIIWADNPIFIFEKKIQPPYTEELLIESIERAINLYTRKSLPYKDHIGAQRYSTPSLKGKRVYLGLYAFNELRDEIKNSEIIWPVIWSITTQCGQLLYDRSNASKYLQEVSKKDPEYLLPTQIAEYYNEIARASQLLKQSYWDERLSELTKIEDLVKELKQGNSFVYKIPHMKKNFINQLRRFLPIMETLWGAAIILDNPKRRIYNLELVDLIIKKEKICLDLLQRFKNQLKK